MTLYNHLHPETSHSVTLYLSVTKFLMFHVAVYPGWDPNTEN